MKLSPNDMPSGIPSMGDAFKAGDMGPMAAAFVNVPAGGDFRPILTQLPEGACPVPHWGYVVKGALSIGYDGGRTELVKEGELFWMEPGHVVWTDGGATYVDFSPGPEMNALLPKLDGIIKSSQQ
jgi:hypothetical protein